MNGWRNNTWKASWGNSWGAVLIAAVTRLKRIVKLPRRYIPFPIFRK